MISEDTVTAVYLAMMGHPPDPEGLEWWQTQTVELLITALSQTERFRERCQAFSASTAQSLEPDLPAAWRLREGRGLYEIGQPDPGVLVHEAFHVFPWRAATAGVEDGAIRVVGAYSRQLAAELRERVPSNNCWAGIDDGPAEVDALVLTGDADLSTVMWAMPQLVTSARRRVISPLRVDFSRSPDEREALHAAQRTRQRTQLHSVGFLQVTLMYQRRFTDEIVICERTQLGAFPGEQVRDSHDAASPATIPAATWLVADRVALESTPDGPDPTGS